MTENPPSPSWLSERRKELYEQSKRFTESRVWLEPKKFVSKRGEELYEQRKLVTEPSKRAREFLSRVWFGVLIGNALAFGVLFIFKEYIVEKYITPAMLEIGPEKIVDSGPWEVFFSVFGIIYAIIVGMLIVEALSRYNNLRSLIAQELNAVEDIRDFLVYLDENDETRPAIRASLRTYVNSVAGREWSEMRNNPEEMDSDTSPELYQVMKAVRKINTNKDVSKVALESIISRVADITTYRTDRYMSSAEYIAAPMRLLILLLSVAIIIGLILMFMVVPLWLHVLMIFACATAMSTLYVMILDLNQPFGGLWDISDKSKSFERLEKGLGTVEITCDDISEQRHIREEIHVSVHDSFQVKLCNPSADFRWSENASIGDQTVVTCHKFVPAPREKQETADKDVWTFKALKKGETWISMKGHQPEESGVKAEWTFMLKVVVK